MNPQSNINDTLNNKLLIKGGKRTMIPHKMPDKQPIHKKGYYYPIETILRKDYHNISFEKDQKVFFCWYQISISTRRERKPFLQYMLWKYPKSTKKYSDLFIFPFCTSKNNNWRSCMNKLKKSLNKEKSVLKGFLTNNNGTFLFFQDELALNKLTLKSRNKQKWWGTISEICDYKHILKFPIHKTVYNLFFHNPKLIYLIDKQNDKPIEIPAMGYYGNLSKKIPKEAVLGTRKARKSMFGPFYYYGSYNAAFRYALWTSNYTTLDTGSNTVVADNEGKFLSDGAILRLILFLGKTKVLLNHNSDNQNKNKNKGILRNISDSNANWSEIYDSVCVGRAPLENNYPLKPNPTFILKKFNQHTVLSVHIVDKKNAPRVWDPYNTKYYIK